MKPSNKGSDMGRNTTAQDLDTYSGRLGANIRARREKLGLSVSEFVASLTSKKVKVKAVTIYAWESGQNPIPLNAVPAIADALGWSVSKLLPKE